MGKKLSKKKAEKEIFSALSDLVKMRDEVKTHVLSMARTHKMMSSCPCLECFSEIIYDFIHNQYEAPISGVLYEILMIEMRDEWDTI